MGVGATVEQDATQMGVGGRHAGRLVHGVQRPLRTRTVGGKDGRDGCCQVVRTYVRTYAAVALSDQCGGIRAGTEEGREGGREEGRKAVSDRIQTHQLRREIAAEIVQDKIRQHTLDTHYLM